MLKFSLGTLLLVVAVVGLGCAALVNFSPLWVELIVGLTLLILCLGFVAALVAQGGFRIFAIGFAAVGWTYFLLTFVDATGLRNGRLLTTRPLDWIYTVRMRARAQAELAAMNSAPAAGPQVQAAAGAQPVLEDLFSDPAAPPPPVENPFGPPPSANPFGAPTGTYGSGYQRSGGQAYYGSVVPSTYDAPRPMLDIGHALWSLLFACAGGVAAQIIRRVTRARHETAVVSAT